MSKNKPWATAENEWKKKAVVRFLPCPKNKSYLEFLRTERPATRLVGNTESSATLIGKEILEASHGVMFSTISLRDKVGTPRQGAT